MELLKEVWCTCSGFDEDNQMVKVYIELPQGEVPARFPYALFSELPEYGQSFVLSVNEKEEPIITFKTRVRSDAHDSLIEELEEIIKNLGEGPK